MSRRKARELALQVFYACDSSNDWSEQKTNICLEGAKVKDSSVLEYAGNVITGVISNLDSIDELISSVSDNWSLNRMDFVDRNILRLAVFEIKYQEEKLPINIVINEALEIAKDFGTDKSASFINAILDNLNIS